jgi:hypothetical protein
MLEIAFWQNTPAIPVIVRPRSQRPRCCGLQAGHGAGPSRRRRRRTWISRFFAAGTPSGEAGQAPVDASTTGGGSDRAGMAAAA